MLGLAGHPITTRAHGFLAMRPAPTLLQAPVSGAAPFVVTASAVSLALRRFRPPSYGWIRTWLEDYTLRLHVVALWEDVFGGVPEDLRDGQHGAWDLEERFVEKVDDELFPLDPEYRDVVWNAGERMMEGYIWPRGYGVAWEMQDLDTLHQAEILVLATVYQSGVVDPPEMSYWRPSGDAFDDELLSYTLARGIEIPAWRRPPTLDALHAFHRALRALDAPLDGLADVLTTLLKTSGNLFLDQVGYYWCGEYDGAYEYLFCWCPTCIDSLRQQYDQARPAIERLKTLKDWYNSDPAAARPRVLAALAECCSSAIVEVSS